MPLIATRGAASVQGFGEFAQTTAPVYIEDVFSTWLYTGNGSTQTITNNIDLSGKGGLVWVKKRDSTTINAGHYLVDTVRGAGNYLSSNSTNASASDSQISAFNSNGFYIGSDGGNVNLSGSAYVSWTFREQPKFFDVVTYTGNGTTQAINHNLGSTPGCVIVKRTNDTGNWFVWHRSLSAGYRVLLNATNAQTNTNSATIFGNNTTYVDPTSTNFTVGNETAINNSGDSFVAYLFAHNAGGFGLSGTDNVISCGSFTQPSSGDATITLGYEPQWVMIKRTDAVSNWFMYDIMRGMSQTTALELLANTAAAEGDIGGFFPPTATGFISKAGNLSAGTYIYIAIRRGPMKTPTSGTSVFSPITTAISSTGTQRTTGFPVDLQILCQKDKANFPDTWVVDRLRGLSSTTSESGVYVITNGGQAESTLETITRNFGNTGFQDSSYYSTLPMVWWSFGRAPGFLDIVCYTGTGVARTVTHGLGVTPELLLVRRRNAIGNWSVYVSSVGATKALSLNSTAIPNTNSVFWNDTAPTSSVFTVGTSTNVNASGGTYVAYLFATVAGVSKVGSYTGTGTTLQIDCGFTSGARFVLIKRTDSTGDWWVYDSARGIVAGNDPYIFWNGVAGEVTNTDYVDTFSSGFELSSTAPVGLNANGGSYIFLAIA